MRVILFELSHAPFSQGFALQEICMQTGGKLLAGGDCFGGDQPDGHGLIYAKQDFNGRIVESIWEDDGLSLKCQYKNDRGQWLHREPGNHWQPVELSLDIQPTEVLTADK